MHVAAFRTKCREVQQRRDNHGQHLHAKAERLGHSRTRAPSRTSMSWAFCHASNRATTSGSARNSAVTRTNGHKQWLQAVVTSNGYNIVEV